MPKKKNVPKMREHKATGQAVVTLTDAHTGRRVDRYCGAYGTTDAARRYAEIVDAWEQQGRTIPGKPKREPKPEVGRETIARLLRQLHSSATAMAVVGSAAVAGSSSAGDPTEWQHDPLLLGDWFEDTNWSLGKPYYTTEDDFVDALIAQGLVGFASGSDAINKLTMTGGVMQQSGGTLETGRFTVEAGGRYEIGGDASLRVVNNQAGSSLYLDGDARFIQNNGEVDVAGSLIVYSDTKPVYEMHGGTLNAGYRMYLGWDDGYGTFLHRGGTVSFPEIYLESWLLSPASGSSYEMSGQAVLQADYLELVRQSGVSRFVQSGGTASIERVVVDEGQQYILEGGDFTTQNTRLFKSQFVQSGGNAVFDRLDLTSGVYTASGGTITIDEFMAFDRASSGAIPGFDFEDGEAELTIASGATADFRNGVLPNTVVKNGGNASFDAEPNALLIFEAGDDPASWFGSYDPGSAMVYINGQTFSVPSGQVYTGRSLGGFTPITDPIEVAGEVRSVADEVFAINFGLDLLPGGRVDLTHGSLNVNGRTDRMSGGALLARTVRVAGGVWFGDGRRSGAYTPAAARFVQSGGQATAEDVEVFADGVYELSGGTLDVGRSIFLHEGAALDFNLGDGTLNLAAEGMADFMAGDVLNASNATITAGPGAYVFFPAGFDPYTDLAGYSSQGQTLHPGDYIEVAAGETFIADGEFDYPLRVAGSVTPDATTRLTLTRGVDVLDGGSVDLGIGDLYIENQNSALAEGTLSSRMVYVGSIGTGLFTQSAGTNGITETLHIGGSEAPANGTYLLQNGLLEARNIYVGTDYAEGNNRLTQHNGRAVASDTLRVSSGSGGTAVYEMFDGELLAGTINLRRTGRFIQHNGSVVTSESDGLEVEVGGYEMRNGTLQTNQIELAGNISNSGQFIQSNGQVTASQQVVVGAYSSTGEYHLRDGSLDTPYIRVGHRSWSTSNTGTFVQSGGTLNTDTIEITPNGRFVYRGGELNFAELSLDGTFDFDGVAHSLYWNDKVIGSENGSFANAASTSLIIGPNTFFTPPADFDPSIFGSFSNLSLTGGTGLVVIPADLPISGLQGTIDRPFQVYGQLLATPGAALTLENSLEVFAGGEADLQDGRIYLGPNERVAITGGELRSDDIRIVSDGSMQSAGVVHAQELLLDSASAVFELSGGTLNTFRTEVDQGLFRQTGGVHNLRAGVSVSYPESAGGGYLMEGGTLLTNGLGVGGGGGRGTFRQTGGVIETAQIVARHGSFILDDGELTAKQVKLGSAASGTSDRGQLHINGGILELGGTRHKSPPGMLIGNDLGRGVLNMTGGQVRSDSLPVYVGYTGPGYAEISGGTITSPELYVSWDAFASLDQTGGLIQADLVQVGAEGTYNLSGGTLDFSGGTLTVQPGGLFNYAGGTLANLSQINGEFVQGGGTLTSVTQITGDFLQTGGTLAPGSSPGVLTIDGDYTMDGGVLEIELAGLVPVESFDLLSVQGDAELGGTLDVEMIDGFTPSLGDAFSFLEASSVTGRFDQTSLPSLQGDMSFELIYSPTDVSLHVVPEPATALLLLPGALLALRRRR